MNLDLFAAPAPAAPPAEPVRESFMMQPVVGVPNRWHYRGVLLGCDMKLEGLIGHWFTVEPLGEAIMKSDKRVELCRSIDHHFRKGRPA